MVSIDQKTIDKAVLGNREAEDICTKASILIPCPHCGGEGKLYPADSFVVTYSEQPGINVLKKTKETHFWYARCESCAHKLTRMGKTLDDAMLQAVHLWNKRMDITIMVGRMICEVFD